MDIHFHATEAVEAITKDDPVCTHYSVDLNANEWLQDSELKTVSAGNDANKQTDPSYKVIYAPKPIGHPHGMTEAEVRLVQEAERHISTLGFDIFYAVLSDEELNETEFRLGVRAYLNRIVQIQKRTGIPPTYVSVFEGETNLHTNILFPLRRGNRHRIIHLLSNAKHFGPNGICVKPAKRDGWFTRYTAKERTHADRFIPNTPLSKRRPGHHPLGKLGGERVRLSKHLESQLIANGRITPRKKTKASKS